MLLLMYFRFSVVLKTKYLSKNLITIKLNLFKKENRAIKMYFNKLSQISFSRNSGFGYVTLRCLLVSCTL